MPSAKDIVAARKANLTTNQQLARENVNNLINLRGQSQGQRGVDINIHGTFARGEAWTKTGSAFDKENTRARNTASTNFQWSGGQTEASRVEAGKQLNAFLKDVNRLTINRSTSNDVNAIAHSHGGNVLGKALGAKSTPSIRNAVMLGTPQMSSGGKNTSWSANAADKVRGQIHNIYDNKDAVQVTTARANEHITGNMVSVDNKFSVKNSITPQNNIRVETGAWLPSVQAHSDMHDAKIGKLTNHLLGQDAKSSERIKTSTARANNSTAKFHGNLNNRASNVVFHKK